MCLQKRKYCKWNCMFSIFISGISALVYIQQLCNIFLCIIGIFSQISDSLNIHLNAPFAFVHKETNI